MIAFACPQCKKTVRAPEDFAGKQSRCPACQTGIVVPGQSQPVPPLPLPSVPPLPPVPPLQPPVAAVAATDPAPARVQTTAQPARTVATVEPLPENEPKPHAKSRRKKCHEDEDEEEEDEDRTPAARAARKMVATACSVVGVVQSSAALAITALSFLAFGILAGVSAPMGVAGLIASCCGRKGGMKVAGIVLGAVAAGLSLMALLLYMEEVRKVKEAANLLRRLR